VPLLDEEERMNEDGYTPSQLRARQRLRHVEE
jgi:hypothetical protein